MTITSAELTWMRDAAEALFPDTCTITTRTHAVDDVGGWVDAVGTTYSNVACRVFVVDTLRELREVVATRLDDEPLWELWVPYDQAIARDYNVAHNSVNYKVIWVDDQSSEILFRRARMRRLP